MPDPLPGTCQITCKGDYRFPGHFHSLSCTQQTLVNPALNQRRYDIRVSKETFQTHIPQVKVRNVCVKDTRMIRGCCTSSGVKQRVDRISENSRGQRTTLLINLLIMRYTLDFSLKHNFFRSYTNLVMGVLDNV